MTKPTEKKDVRKEIVRDFALTDLGAIIGEGLKSPVTNSKAREEQAKYAVASMTTQTLPGETGPRYTPDGFNALDERDKKDKIEEAFTAWSVEYRLRATKSLAENIDDLFSKGRDEYGKADKRLLNVANTKQVVESADGKDKEILNEYLPLVAYKGLFRKIESGDALDVEDEKQTRQIYNAAQAQTLQEVMEKAGRPDHIIATAMKLSQLAPSEKATGEKLNKGVERLVKEAKKGLVDKFGEDFEDKVIGAVGNSLKTMLNSGDDKKTQTAASLWYKSQTGYVLGERDFSKVYK